MIKILFPVFVTIFFTTSSFGQVGINTANPKQLFHTDGKKDNPATGNPSISEQVNDVVITQNGELGIGITDPTAKLDVNGKVRIRQTPVLESINVSSLFVDENGVVGKSIVSAATPKTTFLTKSGNITSTLTTEFNNGDEIIIPLQTADLKLNTLNGTVNSNRLTIPDTGLYQISGFINVFAGTAAANEKIYQAFNIQRSTDNGNTWATLVGSRPIFLTPASSPTGSGYYYSTLLPSVVMGLNSGDLLRLMTFRTKASDGTVQGNNTTLFRVSGYSIHGTPGYILSIVKL